MEQRTRPELLGSLYQVDNPELILHCCEARYAGHGLIQVSVVVLK